MYQGRKWFLKGLICVLMIFVFIGWIEQAQSQEKYPTRAIDVIVPYAPGGSSDVVTRLAAGYLKNKWGVPVNVVNKPGGNTIPACLEIHKAAPDGYTLLNETPPSCTLLPIIIKDLPFKIMDRTYIAILARSAGGIYIVNSKSPIKSMKDLEAEAKKTPGKLTWASNGDASVPDLTIKQFFNAIGVDVSKTNRVVVGGSAETVRLVAGGQVIMGNVAFPSARPAIEGGLVRALATASSKRIPALPDVPTYEELGYPSLKFFFWSGFSGPPKLPSHIVDIWDKTLQEILKDPEFIDKADKLGLIPYYHNPAATQKRIIEETEYVRVLHGS